MWYQKIPDASVVAFLEGVVRLFSSVLSAIFSNAVLSVFLGLAVLMVIVALFQIIFHSAKLGR